MVIRQNEEKEKEKEKRKETLIMYRLNKPDKIEKPKIFAYLKKKLYFCARILRIRL